MKIFKLMAFSLITLSQILYANTLINGAGATFPYPIYSKWFSEYGKVEKNVQINYQSIGSGGGIRQFLDKTVDFGASDSPMTDEQLAKATIPVLHIPTVLGAVVISYNLPGVPTGMKLTPGVITDIFLGKITKWDDKRIMDLNPGFKLSGDIVVAHRSDGSGTTGVFTDYLSKVSSEWKSVVGQGTSVKFPTGIGGKGNEGVAGLIKQTPGSIGYIEFIYAENNKLSYALVENQAKKFTTPSVKTIASAAAGVLKSMPEDFRVSITDAPGVESYPISSFTYLLIYKNQTDPVKGRELVKFLRWALKDGQSYGPGLGYAPLPKEMVSKAQTKVGTIEVNKIN